MPKLKRLSGSEVIKILAKFDFTIYSQKGSHIKLRRLTSNGKETLTIPMTNVDVIIRSPNCRGN